MGEDLDEAEALGRDAITVRQEERRETTLAALCRCNRRQTSDDLGNVSGIIGVDVDRHQPTLSQR